MIQNINFPEGTNVKYLKGSPYDQFSIDIRIDNQTSSNVVHYDGLYEGSYLRSARLLNSSNYNYWFYNSNCIFRLTEARDAYGAFQGSTCFYDVILDKNIPILTGYMFYSLAHSKSFFTISANLQNLYYTFYSSKFKYITFDVDTSLMTSFNNPLDNNTIAIFGDFSVKSLPSFNYAYLTGYGKALLRHITVADIGTNSAQTSVDFSYWEQWGKNTTAIPSARQSVIDSLVNKTFDRASAGYSTCTIKLAANTKALLTEEEIAQITAKGFTIA